MRQLRSSEQGLTLVELLVVLAVTGILLSLAIPSFADMLIRRRVQLVADQIVTDIAFARAETAVVGRSDVDVVFVNNESQSCYTLSYWGLVGTCDCTRGEGNACNGNPASPNFTSRTEIRTTQLMANSGVEFVSSGNWDALSPGQLRFRRPQLFPTVPNFAVTVIGKRGFTLRVQLNALGRISQCSPDGSMPGASAC